MTFRMARIAALGVLMAVSCKDKEPERSAPPPPPPSATAAKPGTCASGGGEVKDAQAAAFVPRTVGRYCVDPQGETTAYAGSDDGVCTKAFDGECEIYRQFSLKRVVLFRYVDGNGGPGYVEVYLSQFNDVGGGFGMFTKRVVGDGDPSDPSAPRVLAAGGAGAIGTGRAYVWKGPYLVELLYNNDREPPAELEKSSNAILTEVAKAVGAKLPGAVTKPPSAEALPTAGLVPNGIVYATKEPLGLANVAAGAIGYYRDGTKYFRQVALVRDEDDRAKDEMKTLRKRPGALPVADLGDEAVHVALAEKADQARVEFVFARVGAAIVGIGDVDASGKPGATPESLALLRLTKDEKLARLKPWVLGRSGDAGKK